MNIKNKTILITGGTGSLGYGLAERLEKVTKKVIVFSRDESKQDQMKEKFPNLTYILGDVSNYFAVREAVRGVDIVIHAAAFKYLDLSETQPTECVLSNVYGSINVIRAAKEEGVKLVCGISTDKAPYARNVYGCTKQIMERLFQEANNQDRTRFIICRYGNVIGTNGSVIPKWKRMAIQGKDLIVTNKKMRRFFFTLDDSIDLILDSIKNEKFFNYKKMKVAKLWDIANKIAKKYNVRVREGCLRPGEKLDEVLVADYEGKEITTGNSKMMTSKELKEMVK